MVELICGNLKKKKKRVILIKQRRENLLSAARWEVGGGDREGIGKRVQTQLQMTKI